ncbi:MULTISPECIES: NUDIX domain-containing protein [unclassified Microbulbifer]|uniref:NUDIX domain-containing protein n=1 Tax=unclassified Microbulbifer TaxID=2619833 RepID=UPI0027E4F844|nr:MULTISPECIES: NUDIX domain-containing protein [unclassified Microbulbifer]
MTKFIKNIKKESLYRSWSRLDKYTFDFLREDGAWEAQQREVYDRGDGAAVLLFNPRKGTVILTRQFRLPTFLNGNSNGMLVEACAGALDGDDPYVCILREIEEETGYRIEKVKKVFEAYMSPGSVTEILHFFTAEYSDEMRVSGGGGVGAEQEYIEVLEYDLEKAYSMIADGLIKDGKTIMLLQYAKLNSLCESNI